MMLSAIFAVWAPLLCAVVLSCSDAPIEPTRTRAIAELASFANPDAVQGHWVFPTQIMANGASYVGFGDSQGRVGVFRDGVRHIIDTFSVDDHCVPSLVQLNSGRVAAFFTEHSANQMVFMRTEDSLGGFTVADTIWASGTVTYTQVYKYQGLHLFYRVGDATSGSWAYRRSTDDGETWSAERVFLAAAYFIHYPHALNPERIRFAAYEHPILSNDHDIYYGHIDLSTGAVVKPSNVILGNVFTGAGLPVPRTSLMPALESCMGKTRLFGIRHNPGHQPIILIAQMTTPYNGRYKLLVYGSPSSWFTVYDLGHTGLPLESSPGAFYYYGGGVISDTNEVYLVREDAGVWRLKRYTLASYQIVDSTLIAEGDTKLGRPNLNDGILTYSRYAYYNGFDSFYGSLEVVP